MKSSNYARLSLLAAAFALGACGADGTFTGTGGAAAGGGLAGGGGGGGGGGPNVGVEPIMQYDTDDVNGFEAAKISGDASTIVWADNSDPNGTNPMNRTHLFSKRLSTGTITQITTGDETFSFDPRDWDVSDDGDFVVFVSSLDWAGTNPNGEENVFLASTTGAGITQVTDINAGVNRVGNPQIADNGVIVFTSADDLVAGSNPGTTTQIFSINSDGTGLAQVTTDLIQPFDVAFADSGNRVAFTSFRDPFGNNVPSTDEIFIIDIDGNNLVQLTNTATDSYVPRISDDGSLVAFAQSGEIYTVTADGVTTVQITDDPNFASGRYIQSNIYGSYDLSGNGNTVVFASSANHTGDNPENYHTIFAARADGTGSITQVLRDGQVAAAAPDFEGDEPSVINDGSGLMFISETNLTSFEQEISEHIYTTVIQ